MRSWFMFVLLGSILPHPAQASWLSGTKPGDAIVVPGFVFGADKALVDDIYLQRIEVYAPGARILEPLADGSFRELPRSDRMFFITDKAKTATRMALSFDREGREFEGAVFNADGTHSFRGRVVGKRLEVLHSLREEDIPTEFSCGASEAHSTAHLSDTLQDLALSGVRERLAKSTIKATAKGATHTAVVAFDTDNEFMSAKFADNTTNAANYVAALITNMNVFYNRDLGVQLLQGDTILRRSSAGGSCTAPCSVINGSDPYSTTTSTPTQLNEVGSTWLNTPALNAIDRAFVMFLSGQSPSANSASGIAWVLNGSTTNYCTSKGFDQGGGQIVGHFSATQVFKFNGSTAASDTGILGHELGHNFGARHTHCTALNGSNPTSDVTSNTIDACFNAESGCYSGTVSCPTDNSISGRGSIMSYCNFGPSSGANCGQVLNEFHPTHESFLATRITTNINNGCFDALVSEAADVSITKTDGSATEVPGTTVTYTITASNAGPSTAASVTVTDTFPAALTGCSTTSVAAGGATGNAAGPVAGNLNDTGITLPSGASVTFTSTCTVSATATGSLANTATITTTTSDPNNANNSATDTNTLNPSADVSITKTDGATVSVPGTPITYTIVASNAGPSQATGVTVADTFPAALSGCSTISVAAGGATGHQTGPFAGNINDGGITLPVGATVTYTSTCSINGGASGSLANTATITASTSDPNNGNNSATDTNTLSNDFVFSSGFEDGEG